MLSSRGETYVVLCSGSWEMQSARLFCGDGGRCFATDASISFSPGCSELVPPAILPSSTALHRRNSTRNGGGRDREWVMRKHPHPSPKPLRYWLQKYECNAAAAQNMNQDTPVFYSLIYVQEEGVREVEFLLGGNERAAGSISRPGSSETKQQTTRVSL